MTEQDALITTKEDELAALRLQLAGREDGSVAREEPHTPRPSRPATPPPALEDIAVTPTRTVEEDVAPPAPVIVRPPHTEAAPARTHAGGDAAARPHSRTLPAPVGGSTVTTPVVIASPPVSTSAVGERRRGKAPPIDPFTGEDLAVRLEDWLPSLERVAEWNRWSPEDQLLQLAGHLRGRALQEWNLLLPAEEVSYSIAVESLTSRLDPGSRSLAAQEFRHAV